jgi:DNA mismatch repair ATPase MutL
VRFFIHINSRFSELLVQGFVATTRVPRFEELEVFVKKMVENAVMENEQTPMDRVRNDYSQSSVCEKPNWHNRVVTGQVIVSSSAKTTHAIKRSRHPTSPFSDAFFDTSQPRISNEIKPSAMADLSLRSLDDAYLDEDKPEFDHDFDGEQGTGESSWTKQRIKGLENMIAGLAPGTNSSARDGKITLTKKMLSSAEVVAQVELKFIIIKTCGIICAVDQHAADERVALEKLVSALSNPDMHDDTVICMTKRSITKRDLLKKIKVNPSKRLSLSQKDMATVKHHWSLLKKWKFDFDEAEDGTLTLTGLPAVCDRVVNVNDFKDFIKELGNLSGENVVPYFVKNIIASNACRYAIMFGDELSQETQINLIESLAKCELCFICAHGRPSVIPLFDMNTKSHSSATEGTSARADKEGELNLSKGENCGPKRIIRR